MAVLGAILLKPGLHEETKKIVPMAAMLSARARDLFTVMGELPDPDAKAISRYYLRTSFATQDLAMPEFMSSCLEEGVGSLTAAKELSALYRSETLADALEEAARSARMGAEVVLPDITNSVISDDKPHEIDFSALDLKQENQWNIHEWLPLDGGLVVLAGEPAGGKTFLCMDLALSMVTGQQWLNMPVRKRRRVLVVDEENSPSLIQKRYKDLTGARANGFHIADMPLKVLHGNGFCWQNGNKTAMLMSIAANHKPDWIILDSLVRIAAGLDENSNADMAKFFSAFVGPLRAASGGAGVIILHHLSKPNQYATSGRHRIRGASDIFAAPDLVWLLEEKTKNKRLLTQAKNRYATIADPIEVTFATQTDGSMAILGETPFDWNMRK